MPKDSQEIDCRPYIECDTCGRPNPAKRCARCSCAFYCTVECQRMDWRSGHKKSCQPLEEMRASLPSLDPSAINSTIVPINASCGICLDEPINKPITLTKCKHAFCFACLKEWQRFRKASVDTMWCPLCRQGIGKSVTEEALDKATLYASKAIRLDKYDHEEERVALFDSALVEVDKILEVDEKDTIALGIKAQILTQVRPNEAIAIIQKTLELDKSGVKERDKALVQLEEARSALDAGNLFKAENIMHSLESEYGTDQATWPTAIGTGPYRLFPVRIVLAEAYEAAERWKDAHKEYSDMLSIFCKKKPHESWLNDEITGQMHSISCGISRCFFHLRQYEKALYSGQQALSMGRTNPGTHKLVAEAQAALARKLGGAQQGEASFAHPNATTAVTIMDAIRTMHRGVIYEAPWDDVNKEANTLYLKELMTEAGLAAMIANFENK